MTRLLLVAAMVVAVLAAAGVGAGAEWDVNDEDGGGADFMSIQAATDNIKL